MSCARRTPRTSEWRANISSGKSGKARPDLVGKPRSDETRQKLSLALTGRVVTDETRAKISLSKRGALHPKWRGGVTPRNKAIRNTLSGWARRVKMRDEYRCVQCGSAERLEADHIEPIALRPDLMFDLANGRTLCFKCHVLTPTYGGRAMYAALRGVA